MPKNPSLIGRSRSEKIDQAMGQLNKKFAEGATQRRARDLGMPYFELIGLPIEQKTLSLVPQDQAESASAVPFYRDKHEVRLGAVDPADNRVHKLSDELQRQGYQVFVYLISQASFDAAMQQYRKILFRSPITSGEVNLRPSPETVKKLKAASGASLAGAAPSELLELVLGAALAMNASDVHLEPTRGKVILRLRVDGVLQTITEWPKGLYKILLSRIKLLAKMKINVTTAPQDGHIAVKAEGKRLDLRVSVLPSAEGESVVIRLLGIGFKELHVEDIGFPENSMEMILKEIKKPNGMILTTGPTGSGKTTTLYSFLNYLNKPGVKIITIEDPVEYELPGITQTPIDKSKGIDFASALRSILRQDPNIVMVGEIRDLETAETASQAALTGHMVLSTLHTNDAAGAIPRLLDLGVKAASLAPALNALIAQRLLRRICQKCKEPYKPPREELDRVKEILKHVPKSAADRVPAHLRFYHGKGCAACHELGYQGQIGVFEAFSVDAEIEKMIHEKASSQAIKKAARKQGMITMQEDGILKALQGITDLAEVWRVTEE